jgi:hypothetical protein
MVGGAGARLSVPARSMRGYKFCVRYQATLALPKSKYTSLSLTLPITFTSLKGEVDRSRTHFRK